MTHPTHILDFIALKFGEEKIYKPHYAVSYFTSFIMIFSSTPCSQTIYIRPYSETHFTSTENIQNYSFIYFILYVFITRNVKTKYFEMKGNKHS
jgi:hypothetical protein